MNVLYIYIYIYIYRERERERERDLKKVLVNNSFLKFLIVFELFHDLKNSYFDKE